MTGAGARLDRRVPGTAVRGDVRSGRARSNWAPCLTGTLAFSVALGLGCTDLGPTPTIVSVTPTVAYSDVPVPLAVDTSMLRSGLVVDIDGESAHYDDGTIHMALLGEDPGLLSSVALGAVQQVPGSSGAVTTFLTTVPADLAPGMYGLRVTAPNGRSVTLPAAFQELGPDTVPPLVTVDMPTPLTVLGVGATPATVTVTLHVDDGDGELSAVTWLASNGAAGACGLTPQPTTNAPPAQIKCQARFQIDPLDPAAPSSVPFSFHVDAIDVANHAGSADVPLFLAHLPSITSFEPGYGPLAGHQAFTIHGAFFTPDAQAFIDNNLLIGAPPGNRMGGDVVDSNTITGFTPPNARPHDATVSVQTQTPAGSTDATTGFRYTSPPRPRLVQPATGPTTGGILVTVAGNDLLDGVTIAFGPTAASAIPLSGASYSSNDKVVGCLPPGQGTVTIWANDPVTGVGSLVDAFTYTDDEGASTMDSPECLPAAAP